MEYEVKLPVDGVDAVRDRLRGLGAVPAGSVRQEDTYFRHPCRDLADRDEAMRLRRVDDTLELTFKGARRAGPVKARPEANVRLHDDPRDLLAGLGFRAAARLSKHREKWLLDGTEVSLDHVDGLGWFVEIEALAETPGPEAAVLAAQRRLGLDGVEPTLRSYLDMALEAGAAAVQALE